MVNGEINRVAVIGAGVMGNGIAQVAAFAGYEVTMRDINEGLVGRGLDNIRHNLQVGIDRGKVTKTQADGTLKRITTTINLDQAVEGADLVIEAIVEDSVMKQRLFRDLDRMCPDHTILASNTSSIRIGKIASVTDRQNRVLGMHFFNPPHIMSLVEVVVAAETSRQTVDTVVAVAHRMGKETIEVTDSPGFATSRLGLVAGCEAMLMWQEGVASIADLDKAMELGYRHPMGPLRLGDLIGLDTRLNIAEELAAELGDRFAPPQILRRMLEAGELGKKSGKGFYDWSQANAPRPRDAELRALMQG